MRGFTAARHVKAERFGKWSAGDQFNVGRDLFVFKAIVRDAATSRSWIEAEYVATGKPRNFNPDVLARRAKATDREVAFKPVAIKKAAPGAGAARSRAVRHSVSPPRKKAEGFYEAHPADWPAPSETTWRNGCRCEPCKTAKREMNRRYRARGREIEYRQRKRVRVRAEAAAVKAGIATAASTPRKSEVVD